MADTVVVEEEAKDTKVDDLLSALDSSDADDSAAEIANKSGEDVKEKEGEEGDEKKEEEDKTKVDEDKVDDKPTGDDFVNTSNDTAELRQIIRAQQRQMAVQTQKLARLEKRIGSGKRDDTSTDGGLFEDDDKDSKDDDVKLSAIEQIEYDLKQVAENRGDILDGLLETMAVNPTYQDVKQVCSQSNFQDMFEAIGAAVADKDGTDPMIAAMEAELAVWKLPNPYQYMYGLIKKYHANYIKKEDEKGASVEDKKTSAIAPDTIVNKGGGSADSKVGWTTKRIDEMEEDDLGSVPKDVYDKYLAGTLE